MSTIAEYLKKVTPEQQAEFERIRKLVHATVPDVEETMSYGIPTFKYKGTYLVHWGAFKDHMSLFPGPVLPIRERLIADGYKLAKGTIQFTKDKTLPDDIIKQILRDRLAAINKQRQ